MAIQKNNRNTTNIVKAKTYLAAVAVTEFVGKNGEEQTSWKDCGVAFKGEKGITVILDTYPRSGKLMILEREVKTDA